MINKVKGTEEFAKQLKETINIFFKRMYALWNAYFFKTSDEHGYGEPLPKEEAIRITKEFDDNRVSLLNELMNSFKESYKPSACLFLEDLNKTVEKMQPYYELDCSFNGKLKHPIDILFIIGDPHMLKTNIIFDCVDERNVKEILLERYKDILEEQADALREREKEVEVMWDDLYCFNFINKDHPTLITIHDFIVRKY